VGRPEWWDPLTGSTRAADVIAASADSVTVALDLDPYGSTLLVVARGPAPRPVRARAAEPTRVPRLVPIGGPWTVSFADASIPTRTQTAPAPWDADETTRFFSGVATYDAVVSVDALPRGATVTLDFGAGKALEPADKGPGMRTWFDAPIRDAATISVNGQPAGVVWCPPYRLDVTALVKPGANTVSIRVGNTALNRMAGRPLPDYRLLVLRYGDRFQPQGMEMVKPLPSGLTGPVSLRITPPR
jgi:hypothetical protein